MPTVNPYSELPPIKNQRLKLTSSAPFVPTFVQTHLAKSTNINPQAVYASRVKDRQIVLENPAQKSRERKNREEKRERRAKDAARRKLGVIGRREAAARGVWKLQENQAKYHLFLPLHNLWLGYMAELLNLPPLPSLPTSAHSMPNASSMHPKLLKADYHGSIMTVRQSKNPSLVGLSGIVIHETENAFKVVTLKDQVKLIPKQNSIFVFRLPLYDPHSTASSTPATISVPQSSTPGGNEAAVHEQGPQIEFELYGNQFRFRAADRAGRKFKHKETIEL